MRERKMAHGPVKEPPAGVGPSVSQPEICVDSADLEFATSVANVRLRTVEEALSACWKSSAQSSFDGSPNKAQLFLDLHRSDRPACDLQVPVMTLLPEVGTELLGF